MHTRAGPWGYLAVGLILVVSTLATVSWAGPGTRAPGGDVASGLAKPVGTGSTPGPLAAAESSLALGAGPAHERPMACSGDGGSIACSMARTLATPVSPSVGLWTNLSTSVGPGPSGRVAVMTWDPSDSYVLLYGGYGCAGSCVLADTWTFANATWTNVTASVTGSPGVLVLPGLAFDPSSGKIILFGGGHNTTATTSATWSYHAKTWTNLSSTVGSTPPGRQFPAMTTDSTAGEIVMTGGLSAAFTALSDTWVFKGGTWTNETSVSGPSGHLFAPVASDDPLEHGVLLTGAQAGDKGQSSTLVYSGGTWTNLTSTLAVEPAPLYLAAAGYIAIDQAVIVYSGIEFNASGHMVLGQATWEFAGGSWTNVTDLTGAPPSTYLGVAGAVDPISESFLLFGGETRSIPLSPWTYVLAVSPIVTAAASRSIVDAGTSVTFSAAVTGGFEPNTVSWNFGDGSANSSTATATHLYGGSGLYLAKVTATSRVGASTAVIVAVYVDPTLSVNASVAGSPTSGSPTAFALGVTGGAAPYTYAWSFGDSASSNVASPSHTYGASGTFTATVKVTDSLGANVTKTLSVSVGAAPSTAVSLTSGTGLGLLAGIVILAVIIVALAALLMRKPKGPVMMAPAVPAVQPYSPPPPPPA